MVRRSGLVYDTLELRRRPELRSDPEALRRLLRRPGTRILPVCRDGVAVAEGGFGLRWLSSEEVPEEIAGRSLFLGEREGIALFAVPWPEGLPSVAFCDLRALAGLVPAWEAGAAALARALWHWHEEARFCGLCGGPTEALSGGHLRRCRKCGHELFPRTDPAVIVLVSRGDRCLLARQARFPPGMYSVLAGFVEPAESLELAVRREVREEVGIEVVRLAYVASQPWPFPRSLMVAFRAEAAGEELAVDRAELEDARWFRRSELRDPTARPVRLPARDSIARHLIESWLMEGE